MIHFVLLISRQGKVRLTKWYSPYSQKERSKEDNELEILEIIQYFVETLHRYFGNVCELDLIFHFHKVYYILDEILIAGELQESSKKAIHRLIAAHDSIVETAKVESNTVSSIIAQVTD
ncbi:Adaptor protein complex, sigma subunit [Cynara cardunculus var. scolymus]|uniref:AP complex subunit sigma n=1 Tax=Cynara cardunculus var. scolymus TaxID=59895 RepID=A0A103XFL3_CYNCS|nr:Adaptor protein complex, sigma subunit [Cynara cardunculus var. scolymus]